MASSGRVRDDVIRPGQHDVIMMSSGSSQNSGRVGSLTGSGQHPGRVNIRVGSTSGSGRHPGRVRNRAGSYSGSGSDLVRDDVSMTSASGLTGSKTDRGRTCLTGSVS